MRGLQRKLVLLLFFLLLLVAVATASAFADCSPYIGQVTINEVNVHSQGNNVRSYYVEIKALNSQILATSPPLWQNWTLDICSEEGDAAEDPCQRNIPIAGGILQNSWLVIDQDIIQWAYLDLNGGNNHGMEIVLRDENDDIVDYLSVDGYSVAGSSGCSFFYDTTFAGGNNFNIQRQPDGIGDWDSTGGGNSGDETENDTNDLVPDGSPSLTIGSASAPAGTPLVFTVTLSQPFAADVTFAYGTVAGSGTAVAGVDYAAQGGTVTIAAGETTATVSVPTFLTATPNSFFYLNLTEVTTKNATIVNNLAIGTILVAAVAEYRFDSCAETDVVHDSSGFGFDGTVLNGPLGIGRGKICNAARFDGIDDYVVVDDSDLFDDTRKLTIMGWINPEKVNEPPTGTNARGILSKRNNASSDVAYGIFFFSERKDGKLYVDIDKTNDRFASDAVIEEGVWTHFAVVFDGTQPADQRVMLYLNGVLDKTAYESATTIPDYNSNLYLGNLYYGTSELKVYKGLMDEIHIIPSALSQADILDFYNDTRGGCESCAQVDHYRFYHDGAALSCAPETIQVKACLNTDCSDEFPDPVNATFAPEGWVGGSSKVFTSAEALQLWHTTPATVTLGVSGNHAEFIASNPPRCFIGATEQSNCLLEFFDSGFVFAVPDLTACQTSSDVTIQAVRTDEITQTCVVNPNFANTSTTVNFWSHYANPLTGTEHVRLSGTPIAGSSPGTGIPLNFDGTASASFTVTYQDAGQLLLNARYTGAVGASDEGLVLSGNDIFISRPVGLCVYSDDVNADCASGNGSCSAFRRVDEMFNLKVKGVCWESSGDTDLCSGNSTTSNFELSNIAISQNLVAPNSSGSSVGSLGVTSIDIASADNGEHIVNNQTVSEVGVFTFTATPPDYFGIPLPAATSSNIGRFIPSHYKVRVAAHGSLAPSCNSFTYIGQPFGYVSGDYPTATITALNSVGNTTVNYRDGFVKLINPATQISMAAVNADSSNLGADATTLLAFDWSPDGASLLAQNDGTLTFALGDDQFRYLRNANSLVAPFTSDIDLEIITVSDSDAVSATGLPERLSPVGIELRYGRMVLDNAYGPETMDLTMPLRTEYYNGSTFIPNNIDNCTPYTSTYAPLDHYLAPLSAGDTTVSGAGILVNGFGSHMSLSAPGEGNDGGVYLAYDLDAAGLEWLQFDWEGDGSRLNPTAKATFGIFKGNPRLIYTRESVW